MDQISIDVLQFNKNLVSEIELRRNMYQKMAQAASAYLVSSTHIEGFLINKMQDVKLLEEADNLERIAADILIEATEMYTKERKTKTLVRELSEIVLKHTPAQGATI